MTAVRFVVPGEPQPAERPRTVTLHDGRRMTYTPKRTREAEDTVGWRFREAAPAWRPDGRDYEIDVAFEIGSRRRKDLDNLLKTVLDGLTGVAWVDDSQVVKATMSVLRGSPRPRTVVEVRESPGRVTPGPVDTEPQ